jgi:hypothetical protein
MDKEKSRFIDKKAQEWFDNQDGCCSCHVNPPCGWCVDGYSLPLAEYLQLAVEDEFGPQDSMWYIEDEPNPHEDFDRAMKDLF